MLRKKKNYVKPRQIYQAGRIKEENVLVKKYGLKNKREIWKTLAKVNYFRHRAKALARSSNEEQEVFFGKLRAIGLKVDNTADALDLKVEDLLERRLQTIIAKKKLAHSSQHARQLVVHKKVLVNGKVMNAPSYLVPIKDEGSISVKQKATGKKLNKGEKAEEVQEEIMEENE